MNLIVFETAVIALTVDDGVLIALFDGAFTNSRCVALLSCTRETAEALTQGLRSIDKPQAKQPDDEI